MQELPGNVLLLGEMGIGNTSAASFAALQTGGPGHCAGARVPGTGLNAAAIDHKIAIARGDAPRAPA